MATTQAKRRRAQTGSSRSSIASRRPSWSHGSGCAAERRNSGGPAGARLLLGNSSGPVCSRIAMPNYELRYETRECRCTWCWETIDALASHVVVASVGSPFLELRFHHACWSIYRGCSGIEGRERDALYREWSPQRVDTLRMHAGLNQKEMAGKLHIPQEKLIAYLKGDCTLSHRQLSLLRDLAVDTKFERQEAGAIDWSDRRACLCLAMHCGWKAPDMARRLGVAYATVTAWWDK